MRRTLALLTAVSIGSAIAGPADAGTYRWVDRQGNVIYSDRPPRPEEAAPAAPGDPEPGAPPRPPATTQATVDLLLDATGLKQQAQIIALQTRDALYGNVGRLSAAEKERVESAGRRHFHPDVFYGLLRQEFSRHADDARAREVAAWFDTPLGKRISVIEVRFYASDRRKEVEDFVAGLMTNRPSPTRLALLQRLDAATGSTEGSLDLFVALNQSITRVVDPFLPPQQRARPGQIESQGRQIRLQMQEQLRQSVLVTMLLMYQSLSDADLRAYIDFMESEAGAWYGRASRQSIVQAVVQTVEQAAVQIARVVPPQRWVSPFKKQPLPTADQRL